LLPGGGLGIAIFSYEGKLCWGFNADSELLPDLPTFVSDLSASFEALRAATVSAFMERRTAAPEIEPEPTGGDVPSVIPLRGTGGREHDAASA
jgi:hypothetical protein